MKKERIEKGFYPRSQYYHIVVIFQDINEIPAKKIEAVQIIHGPMGKFGSKSIKGWMKYLFRNYKLSHCVTTSTKRFRDRKIIMTIIALQIKNCD